MRSKIPELCPEAGHAGLTGGSPVGLTGGRRDEAISAVVFLFVLASAGSAASAPDSHYYLPVSAQSSRPARLKLPLEALDKCRADFSDIRVVDEEGAAVPFAVETPSFEPPQSRKPVKFSFGSEEEKTSVTLETGVTAPLESLVLETPDTAFSKTAYVKSSRDGSSWELLARSRPVFRREDGRENLAIDIPRLSYKRLKILLDDSASQPIAVTGVTLGLARKFPAGLETVKAELASCGISGGISHYEIRLPARNLFVYDIELSVDDRYFERSAALSLKRSAGGKTTISGLALASVFRIAPPDGPPVQKTVIPVLSQAAGEAALMLDVPNGKSPPLKLRAVSVRAAPVTILFKPRKTGKYYVLIGGSPASPAEELKNPASAAAEKARAGALAENPGYKKSPPVSSEFAGRIDVSSWKYRAPLALKKSGFHRLELSLEALSAASRDLSDLRLVSDGKEVPYALDRGEIIKSIPPAFSGPSSKNRLLTWELKLARKNLPIREISCLAAPRRGFAKDVRLYEVMGAKGAGKLKRILGSARWAQAEGRLPRRFILPLELSPAGDTVYLETEGGRRPDFYDFAAFYPTTRLLFKFAPSKEVLWLYYGNGAADRPKLLSPESFGSADFEDVLIGKEEAVKPAGFVKRVVGGTVKIFLRLALFLAAAVFSVFILAGLYALIRKAAR